MLNEAYAPSKLNEQLSANAKDFFSRRQNFLIDQNGTIHVSAILNWFGADFGGSQVERFRYLQPYLPESAREIVLNPRTQLTFQEYNWKLNDQLQKPAASPASGVR